VDIELKSENLVSFHEVVMNYGGLEGKVYIQHVPNYLTMKEDNRAEEGVLYEIQFQ
jgi:hypothetical protein